MKRIFPIYLIICICLTFSCRQNRLKTDEKILAEDIRVQEKRNREADLSSGQIKARNGSNIHSVPIRRKEIRKVDLQKPPVRIILPGKQDNIRKFKLSDIASSVRYVRLEVPPDTMLLYYPFFYRRSLMSSVISDGERIIFQGLFGVTYFDMNGKYISNVWRNREGIEFYRGSPVISGSEFFGILPFSPVTLLDSSIYFNFSDGYQKKGVVMKYRPPGERQIEIQNLEEFRKHGKVPGDTLLIESGYQADHFEQISGAGTDLWAGINNKWNSGKSGTLMVTYNESGDTICKFTDYERIVDFTKNVYRRPVNLISYRSDGLLTIKPEYNDTVFRLIGSDRFLPVYIIDFGELKVTFREGLNPDLDLSEKLVLKSLHETNDYLLIRYTKNYDSPNNMRNNAVRFYNVLFEKNQGKLYHQPDFTLLPEDIQNDIDGSLPFWPDYVTPQGEMMKLVSGKIIKDFINSDGFKTAAVSDENRKRHTLLASGLRNTDMVIMIVK